MAKVLSPEVEMQLRRFGRIAVGILLGAFAGIVLGILVIALITIYAVYSSPEDPTAGSIAILVLATAPMGGLTGAIWGGLAIDQYPKQFWRFMLQVILPIVILATVIEIMRQPSGTNERRQPIGPTIEEPASIPQAFGFEPTVELIC